MHVYMPKFVDSNEDSKGLNIQQKSSILLHGIRTFIGAWIYWLWYSNV